MEFLGYCKCLGNNLNVIYPFIFIYIIRKIQKNSKKEKKLFSGTHVYARKIFNFFSFFNFQKKISKNFQKFFQKFFSNKNIHKIKMKKS